MSPYVKLQTGTMKFVSGVADHGG